LPRHSSASPRRAAVYRRCDQRRLGDQQSAGDSSPWRTRRWTRCRSRQSTRRCERRPGAPWAVPAPG